MIGNHAVLDKQFLYTDGCFKKVRYWISGHHDLASMYTTCKYIAGHTGPETEVTIDIITPLHTFEVARVQGVAA